MYYSIVLHSRIKADGTYPIKIRLRGPSRHSTSKRPETTFSTKLPSCKKNQWNSEAQRYNKKIGPDYREWNALITRLEVKCEKIKNKLIHKYPVGTIEDFKELLRDKYAFDGKPPKSVRQKFIEFIEDKKALGKTKTASVYADSLSAWSKFSKKPIPIMDLDYATLKKFDIHLTSLGLRPGTISVRMRSLRALWNDERKMGGIPRDRDYPFDKLDWKRLKKVEKGHDDLNLAQFLRFMQLKTTTEYEELFKDIYIFSVLSNGINFKDIVYLKPSNIRNIYNPDTKEEAKCLVYKRSKTEDRVEHDIIVELHPKALAIIRKHQSKTKYLFPIHDGKKRSAEKESHYYDGRLKRFRLNIKKLSKRDQMLANLNITPYTGRLTFANLAVRQGATINDIRIAMGHSTEKQTIEYLRKRNLIGGARNLLLDI